MNASREAPSKLNLRLPPSLRAEAEAQAAAMGLSLNAYVVQALRNFIPYTARQGRALARPTSVQPRAVPAQTPVLVKVGRNDPCPCGSGRKAKQCHPEAC